MALNVDQIDVFTEKRILAFLNGVRNASELTSSSSEGGAIVDNPDSGAASGYTIGATVATRIIQLRNTLRGRRFTSVDQLEGVDGFGQDKLNDLVFSFSLSAEEQFKQQLFDGILLDNWRVRYEVEQFEDLIPFKNVAENRANFEDQVIAAVRRASFNRFGDRSRAYLAGELARDRYVESYLEAHLGSYGWALWFYRFDQDNWFSFERMRTAVEAFLSTYYGISEEIELHLFKGYPNGAGLAEGIIPNDLPVTINHAEQRIAVWTIELFD